jgi:hypothetical protein
MATLGLHRRLMRPTVPHQSIQVQQPVNQSVTQSHSLDFQHSVNQLIVCTQSSNIWPLTQGSRVQGAWAGRPPSTCHPDSHDWRVQCWVSPLPRPRVDIMSAIHHTDAVLQGCTLAPDRSGPIGGLQGSQLATTPVQHRQATRGFKASHTAAQYLLRIAVVSCVAHKHSVHIQQQSRRQCYCPTRAWSG